MAQTTHFISGLPRSGSALLSALLRQNPRFHAGLSTPLASILQANLQMLSAGTEAAHLIDEAQKPAILQAISEAYCRTRTDREVVFDTNRGWCSKMSLIAELFPQAKVIACVRDVSWILDSFERIVRKNPFQNSPIFSGDERATVYSRVETLMRQDRLIGFPWAGLKEAFYGDQASRVLVVDYELLSKRPESTLRLIYDFIGEPLWDGHDFDNVEFDAPEFDAVLGLSGMHKIAPKVEFTPRTTLLPPDLFAKYQGMDFWRDVAGSAAHVIAPTA
ncbi:MAG: sulfotransferase [Rhodospirillales bacterium]|nr:sulfotransferase [Rhodospirillales bacterium]